MNSQLWDWPLLRIQASQQLMDACCNMSLLLCLSLLECNGIRIRAYSGEDDGIIEGEVWEEERRGGPAERRRGGEEERRRIGSD